MSVPPASESGAPPVPVGRIVYTAVPYVAEPVLDEPPAPAAALQPQAPSASAVSASAAPPPDEAPADEARFGVRRDFFYSALACLASAAVHFVLILLLGLWITPQLVRPKVQILEASVEERSLEEVVQRLDKNLKPATQLAPSSSASANASSIAMASMSQATQVAAPKLNTTVVDRPTAVHVDVGAVNVFTTAGSTFAASVPQGTLGEALTAADGYGEAMDRLTQEILNKLARGKVLVVWVFDQSLSMKDDQAEIRDRIEKVYEELGLSSAARGDALWTGVVSYGKDFAVHTPKPTTFLKEIKTAIDAVPVDESGEEMMCQAVGQAVANFRQFSGAGGGRQMMIVLVSDESGNPDDNQRSLEPTIKTCKDAKAGVYVLGREAVFGYPFAHMNWTVSRPAVGGGPPLTRDYVVAVDRGPETPMVEMLQTEGFQRRFDAHPSGFGPYEQVRLARETGGMFLMLPSPEIATFRRDDTVFDIEAMRPYLPDLRSRDQYAHERDYSPNRALLWKVVNDLNPYKPEIGRYINLAQRFDGDRATWTRQMDAEIAKARQYVLYLDAAERALRDSRNLRDREKEPRWRAHYDLMLAQVVAYKARVYEYGAYLTNFKVNPKPFDPPTANRVLGRWDLRERGATVADKVTKPLVEDATNQFRAIMAEYDGTPWASRAAYELSRGFGIDLVPIYFNPNPPPNPRRPVTPFAPPKI